MERNKQWRRRIQLKKWKRRLKNLRLPWADRYKYTCYKNQGKPCSCYICSPKKI